MLEVLELSIEADNKSIVEQSSFSLPLGKITSIIGESGSGKSMTVAALLDILPPDGKVTGQALLNGVNLLDYSNKEIMAVRKSHIFTIFQDSANSFNPSVKMKRQLFELSGRKMNDTVSQFQTKMGSILTNLGLATAIMEQYPFELSGGMLQRCMIACAFYVKPNLLIADEPTSAIDVLLQKEFIELMRRLNVEHGTTILLITHDLDVVAEAAEEMVVMQNGKVVESGKVETLLERPQHSYTKRLLNSRF